ncbi:MAG TPA: efflux RND transporter periplasmic adaptor subunit [Candidatus Bathyarchaeia archaeon]|nr:efflux RND transporter periplasmic adaptor subunit [Candidatus Bathyarchaeia archaeon]
MPEKTPPSPLSSAHPSPTDTLLITASSASATLTRPARLTYAEDEFSVISSPLQGRVLEVRARLGESVKSGQILMLIDSPDIAMAYSDYVKEISELSLAQRNYELASDLFKVQALPLKEYKQAENDLNRERAEFAQAKNKLLFLGVPASELEKPLVDQHITSRFELKSPLTGTVVERNVTPGQSVGPGTSVPLLTVAQLDRLHVMIDVYERDLPLLKVGQVVRLNVEAYSGVDFLATIGFIGDIIDPNTRTIKVRALAHNTDRRLKPQMYGHVTVPIDDLAQIILVPRHALTRTGSRTFVYVERAPGRFEPRVIQVQEEPGDQVRVVEGLVVGERIASQGMNTLPPG